MARRLSGRRHVACAAIALVVALAFPSPVPAGSRSRFRPSRPARTGPGPRPFEQRPIRHRGSRAVRLPELSAPIEPDGAPVRLRPWLVLWRDAGRRVVGANGWLRRDRFHLTTYQWRRHIPASAFLIGGHGAPGRFEQLPTAAAIAAIAPAARRLGHIFLQVCSGAVDDEGGVSLALRIARATGRPVVAPNGPIMGDTIPGPGGESRLVFAIVGSDAPDAPAVLPFAQAWSVVYPDGRKRPLIMARYFSELQESGDSVANTMDPRAASAMQAP